MNHVTSFTHVSSSSSSSSLSSSPLLLILVPRMLLLLLVAQATAKTATEEIAAPCYFKVMTLNAFNFVDAPDWGERVHEIREMVIRNDPDCVAFEEVRIVEGNISMIVR